MEKKLMQRVTIETDECLGDLTITAVVTQTVDDSEGDMEQPSTRTPIGEDSVEIETIYDEMEDPIDPIDIPSEDMAMIKAMLIKAANDHVDDFEEEDDFDDDLLDDDLFQDEDEDDEEYDEEEDDLLDDEDE